MWVFDGNGFTMACLAVWIRTVALRWDLPQWRSAQERWMRPHPTAPVNVARISVTTSVTDFTAPEADFAALLLASVLGDHICHVEAAGVGTAPVRLPEQSGYQARRRIHLTAISGTCSKQSNGPISSDGGPFEDRRPVWECLPF